MLEAVTALAISSTCLDWSTPEASQDWTCAYTMTSFDVAERVPVKVPLGTNVHMYASLVPINRNAIAGLESGKIDSHFFDVVAAIRAQRELHLEPTSRSLKTRYLQRTWQAQKMLQGGGFIFATDVRAIRLIG